jgi:GTP cyclohydrolase I
VLKTIVTNDNISQRAQRIAADIIHHKGLLGGDVPRIWGIPRGGCAVAYAVQAALAMQSVVSYVVNGPSAANVIVDDLIDSGATLKRAMHDYPHIRIFSTLYDKQIGDKDLGWLVFPWEDQEGKDTSANDIVIRMLQRIGEDPEREGLRDTPQRVVKAWNEWFSGYRQDPEEVLKAFVDGAENYSGQEMVIVKNIPVYSMCEHHMAPFFGTVAIGYIPNGKIVGLSKLSRLTDIFARRLQVQERLTNQIADALCTVLNPIGAAVLIQCRHMCMESRGVRTTNSSTVTSAMRGALMDKPAARAEFLELIK